MWIARITDDAADIRSASAVRVRFHSFSCSAESSASRMAFSPISTSWLLPRAGVGAGALRRVEGRALGVVFLGVAMVAASIPEQ